MAEQEPHLVAVFASVHDVVAGEKALKEAGLFCDMIPTPRKLSSDCGMSLEIHHDDRERAEEIWRAIGARLVTIVEWKAG